MRSVAAALGLVCFKNVLAMPTVMKGPSLFEVEGLLACSQLCNTFGHTLLPTEIIWLTLYTAITDNARKMVKQQLYYGHNMNSNSLLSPTISPTTSA